MLTMTDKRKKSASVPSAWAIRLKKMRVRLGLSQAEAAARIKVSQSVWSAWERGTKTPSASIRMLIDLAFSGK